MKDYACERIYRDARITSIYEGTTQLQVVAAIRHVTTGTYMTLINGYDAVEVREELAGLKENLRAMTAKYQEAVAKVAEVNDQAFTDFMARRLVEMASNVVMGYLLLLDAQRSESFVRTASVYNKMAEAEVAKHSDFIAKFNPAQQELYTVR